MRIALLVVLAAVGCDPAKRPVEPDGPPLPPDSCSGELECRIHQCTQQGLPATTISGKVFAPNGTLPLYGVNVYVPREDPGELEVGAVCTRCTAPLAGGFIVDEISDDRGEFRLTNVPAGPNVPLVIQIGKWRKRLDLDIIPCTDNALSIEQTRLPRNPTEGDMPKIAIVTGQFDALECLLRKLGIDDAQFTSDSGTGQINLYASNGATSSAADGGSFLPATSLWSDLDRLKRYDIAMFSCEGEPFPNVKTQPMMDTLKAYADFGGRVFLSHYHHIWIDGERNNPSHAPAVWPDIATCDTDLVSASIDLIDQTNNPKGPAFADWMVNVGGSPQPGVIPIAEGRQTCRAIDMAKAERWVVANNNGMVVPQNFQFTTPNEVVLEERCGKVVFSDMHVASGSTSSGQFPNGCSSGPLTPQEKALAFMFFDVASCIGVL